MGDPVSVGAALDQTHKPAPQWGIIGLVLLLFVLGGIIQVLLLKTIPAGNDALATRSAQVLFVFLPLSLATFVGMYFLDFSFFGKHPYVLPLGLLMVDLAAHLFGVFYGGKRWLILGSFALSPLALSLLFPLAFCGLFYRLRSQGRKGYLISGVLAAVFCLFLSYCHTFSGVLTFVFSAGVLMLVASKKKWFDKQRNMFLLLFLFSGVTIHTLIQSQTNGRLINYVGIVRGATQRLVKLELSGNPNDPLIDYLDSILAELQGGTARYGLPVPDDPDYLSDLSKLEVTWGRDQDGDRQLPPGNRRRRPASGPQRDVLRAGQQHGFLRRRLRGPSDAFSAGHLPGDGGGSCPSPGSLSSGQIPKTC